LEKQEPQEEAAGAAAVKAQAQEKEANQQEKEANEQEPPGSFLGKGGGLLACSALPRRWRARPMLQKRLRAGEKQMRRTGVWGKGGGWRREGGKRNMKSQRRQEGKRA
jgi:hypothetical protein